MTLQLSDSSTHGSILEDEDGVVPHSIFALSFDTFQTIQYLLARFFPMLSGCGVVSNVINIVVFTKMGFLETINIMFFVLSISDLTISVVFDKCLLAQATLHLKALMFYFWTSLI